MLSYLTKRPIFSAFCILIATLLLRLNDIFILRIDELWGEIIISKALGFILILLFMFLIKENLSTIGLHQERFGFCIAIGFFINLFIYIFSYCIEYMVLLLVNEAPQFIFAAIDPKQGVNGGIAFGLWLILGNVVNSLMEEGLFRGLFLPAFKSRYSFWKANAFQALLFGAWHLVWPLKNYLMGEQSFLGALMMGLVLMLGTCTFGFIWGYMFEKTNSLWTPIAAHFAANTIQNILHIQSNGGIDAMVFLRGTFASFIGVASIFTIKWIASKYRFPTLSAWKAYAK
ncbi:type II CAAX endopeptidase family protein [Oscillospiraceae bacterium PP1C4]